MEWQPIETVPVEQMVLVAGRYPNTDVWWRNVGRKAKYGGHWYNAPFVHDPTHWMPLPEPPQLTTQPAESKTDPVHG